MSGMILIITPSTMAIMAPNAVIFQMNTYEKLVAIGIGIDTVALAILTFLTCDTPLYVIIVAMGLQGFGMGLLSSPNMNTKMSSVSPKDALTASASQARMRTIGHHEFRSFDFSSCFANGSLNLDPQYASMIMQASQTIV